MFRFLVLILLAWAPNQCAAFVGQQHVGRHRQASTASPYVYSLSAPAIRHADATRHHMLPFLDTTDASSALALHKGILSTMPNSMWLATIDSDIASISDNEFAPIFLGGILVMFGGVISALIVGFILEKGDLYANVVADSYVQGGDDEQFWKGLSEEEKKKTQALIQKLNDKKALEGGGSPPAQSEPQTVQVTATATPKVEVQGVDTTTKTKVPAEMDMFSDYADDA